MSAEAGVDQLEMPFTEEELVVDAHHSRPRGVGGIGGQCSVSGRWLMGQQFVPGLDNVAAVSFDLLYTGRVDAVTVVRVRLLDAGMPIGGAAQLAETSIELVLPATTSDMLAADLERLVFVEFAAPTPVVPGTQYLLELSWDNEDLFWWFNGALPYADGASVNCTGEVLPEYDYGFATYAFVGSPPDEPGEPPREVLTEVDPDPATGEMTGPNADANAGRLGAFDNMLADADAQFAAGDQEGGCNKLDAARSKVTGPHAWFAGETAQQLLAAIDAQAEAQGCP